MSTLGYGDVQGRLELTMSKGDTLTYTLGAMKPETVSASVITADDTAKQLALNKVSDHYGL